LIARNSIPLDEILFLVICATVSGCQAWDEIADFGKIKLSWLQRYLPYSNGIPSPDTLNQVIGLLDHLVLPFDQVITLGRLR
jgi:hypothetical protein